ncbi:MAG: regulatory protein RecX, partial [Salinibacterium sp.]|nr:regulatory protein RecX [Salinibacterium sp.]
GDDEQGRRAENVSMHALTRRGMSRWELGQVLLGRELEPHIVEAELERLERVGLIDDAALAETVVRTQHERKGLGKAALVALLRRRNIEQNVIDEALVQVSAEDEAARAESLAERRAAQLTGLDHDTAVRRLSGYLQRKGYSSETVRAAVIAALPRHPSGVRFR